MKKVYLDNASTTAMRSEVIEAMTTVMAQDYGNPSSTHSFGRNAKSVLELSRKAIAKELNVSAQEIIFTSGGTEADNWILRSAVKDLGVKRIITSRVEHHAVLHSALLLEKEFGIEIDYVNVKIDGTIDYTNLVEKLANPIKSIVSLMHVNNETGALLDLDRVVQICTEHNVLFHSDTVQSMGKVRLDLQKTAIDFVIASAHKFHGPKGVGFAYVKKNSGLQPMLHGGEQEKGLRAGTEAVHQIVGMAKALTVAYENLEIERSQIELLKSYLITQLEEKLKGSKINGGAATFYNVVNVLLPFSKEKTAMILFHLDMKGIAVSRGSACQSGSIKPSHVLAEMLSAEDLVKPSLRISLSHFNTNEDIDILITALQSMQE
ncbi:cysteine desulfurase family protein [Flavobacterium sp. 14A]|uniref:cysteine desulfurase family protein n=1 Tax=Flavobacterium sp. 14A TaxID=2735896 RepID=UPI0015704BB8|nr:cysteine desulfurase family protein [Flavobacterium sp. 14A]NRT12573.1 cysteine desulfurase [Flavobacterium sp. 14A]